MPGVLQIVTGLVAGLALFLYGVNLLSEELNALGSEKVRNALERFTSNRLAGVCTGTVATTLLDSSSLTIILVISLVSAGLLAFEQSLAVIMGANIGTTISSQIFAFNVDKYSPFILAAGLLTQFAGPKGRIRDAGRIVFALGLVFFGLHYIGEVMEPLREHEPFLNWLKRAESPLYGALVGALFTAVIQSSSATMGIVITMASQEMITLPAGVSLMLGAEIGTCLDTLIATIGRSRSAVRAGIFHLMFNVTTVALGIAVAPQLAQAATWLSFGGGVGRQIANGHVLFNVAGVALVIGFVPAVSGILMRILPEDGRAPAPDSRPIPEAGVS